MYERADTSFQQSTESIKLNNTLGELGFEFYFAFTDLRGGMPDEISGYLDFEISQVSRITVYSEDSTGIEKKPVGYHKCGESDLRNAPDAVNEEETKFLHERIRNKAYCVNDRSKIRLLGDAGKSIDA